MMRSRACPIGLSHLWLLVPAILLAWTATPAAAQQQRYDLAEDDSWETAREIDPASPEGQLLAARRALAEGRAAVAEEQATRWIDANPEHRLLPEAYLLRGDALVAQNEEYEALFDYEYIARVFFGSEVFVTALEREFEIAKDYARGKDRKLWGIRFISAYDEAEELLIRIQERLPGSELAERAGLELGDFYFRRQNMSLAAEAYDLFIENYPNSPDIPKARKRLIASYLAGYKGPEFDAAGLDEARLQLRRLQRDDPAAAEQIGADALLAGIAERRAAKLLTTAHWYLRTNDPIGAEFTLRRLVKTFPRTQAARDGIGLAVSILDRLPPAVIANAPDYRALLGDAPDASNAEPPANQSGSGSEESSS